MAEDQIRYDVLAQEALRGVVRKVLAEVAKTGLPGEHHFFIAFDPRIPGVRMSSALRERYPEELTIVLQHQFWDLSVTEHSFEVGLSFNGVPERLLVPFAAVKGFFDPSVQFGLQFEVVAAGAEASPGPTDESAANLAAHPPEAANSAGDPSMAPTPAANGGMADKVETAEAPAAEAGEDDAETEDGGAAVVSLDAFRNKKG